MKNNAKYIVAGLLLVSVVATTAISLSRANQNNDTQDPFADQLSDCQKNIPSYVGLPEQDAIKKADQENHTSRIVMRDGVSFPVTEDYSPSRLNFVVTDGLITKASCG